MSLLSRLVCSARGRALLFFLSFSLPIAFLLPAVGGLGKRERAREFCSSGRKRIGINWIRIDASDLNGFDCIIAGE